MSSGLLRPLAEHAADQVVLVGGRGSVCTAELRRRVCGLREQLASGSGRGVVLACAERETFYAGLLAAWSLALEVWLPQNVQAGAIEDLGAGTEVRAVLHDCDGASGLDVREVPMAPLDPGPLPWLLEPQQVAVVVHTSGSTGAPTAHPKTWQQLEAETAVLLELFGLRGRCVVATVPPHHIYGLLFGVLVPLCGGGRVASESPLLPRDVARVLEEVNAEVLVSVPAQLRSLSRKDIPEGCRIFSSGAPLPLETGQRLRARGGRLVEVLGSTETGGMAARESATSAWQALPSVTWSVAADGRLCLDSSWLPPGSPRPFVCADRVVAEGAGFRHLGRADRVVKLGGRRVDLGAIERALETLAGVRESRVVAVPSAGLRGYELLAVVEGERLDAAQLRAQLCEVLDPVTVPRRYRVVVALPRTIAGKLTDAVVHALFGVDQDGALDSAQETVQEAEPPEASCASVRLSVPPVEDSSPAHQQVAGLAEAAARSQWPELGPLARAQCSCLPAGLAGSDVVLSLTRASAHEVSFDLRFEGRPAGSGQLLFQEDLR